MRILTADFSSDTALHKQWFAPASIIPHNSREESVIKKLLQPGQNSRIDMQIPVSLCIRGKNEPGLILRMWRIFLLYGLDIRATDL